MTERDPNAAPGPTAIDPYQNLLAIRQEIADAVSGIAREPQDITIVAVTKKHGVERILPLLEGGHRVFGENRVQEAQGKWPDLRPRYPDLTLHLIGPLQSNKTADAVALFDVIETVDRPKIANAIATECARQNRSVDVFIQVNTGDEPQKAGVRLEDLEALVTLTRDELSLPLKGLMCIPPVDEAPAPHFALLAKLSDRYGLVGRSMGMSGDFAIAASLGATHVRIGTQILGPRPPT
ncbi:MAG: YggS family pyridoxal phosphate-dependent enzyme [Pseudomonadota bacterium]